MTPRRLTLNHQPECGGCSCGAEHRHLEAESALSSWSRGYNLGKREAAAQERERIRLILEPMTRMDSRRDEVLGIIDAVLAAASVAEGQDYLLPCGHDRAQQWWGRCRKCTAPAVEPAEGE